MFALSVFGLITIVRARLRKDGFFWMMTAALLAVTSDGSAAEEIWNLRFRQSSTDFTRCEPVTAAVSPDSKTLAVGCGDHSIRIWDLKAGRELRRLIGHTEDPSSIVFSPDGKRLLSTAAAAYPRSPMHVWSVESGELLYDHRVKTQSAGAVAWHPSGSYFAAEINTLEFDGKLVSSTVEAFDAKTFRHLHRIGTLRMMSGHLCFSTDGRQLLFGGGDVILSMQQLDLQSRQLKALPVGVSRCAFSPDGRYIAGRHGTESLVILDAATHAEVRRIALPPRKNGGTAGTRFVDLTFSPDSQSVFASTDDFWFVWNIASGKGLHWGALEYASPGKIILSPDGMRLIEVAGHHQLIVWDTEKARRLAMLHCLDELNQWAIQTADGYFQHSDGVKPEFQSNVSHSGEKDLAEEFRSSVLVARLLDGMKLEDALATPEHGTPPTVNLQLVKTEQEVATLHVVASTDTPGGTIRNVSVRINGRELSSLHTKALRVDPVAAEHARLEVETKVQFPPGQNSAVVRVIATDSFGQRSNPSTIQIERPNKVAPVTGRLFVLCVGVSEYANPEFNLRYSHVDAEVLSEILLKQKGRAFGDVQTQVFTNKQATVTNIKGGLEWLRRSCTPSDVAVVLFSGHGITREKGLYYVTHEADLNGVQFTCLNWEVIAESLGATQARQVLFLSDACYAGAFGESTLAPQTELADTLRQKAGVMVFASSQNDEVSLEDPAWGHGAFCRAILNGLEGNADQNRDGRITVDELQRSVTAEVVALTGDRQHPRLPGLSEYDPNLVIAVTAAP